MPRRLLVPAAVAKYIASRGNLDPRSLSRFAEMARAVRAVYPRLAASRFAGPQLKRVRRHLLERTSRRTGETLSRTYINHLTKSAVRCWRWLLSEGLVSAACVVSLQAVEALRVGEGGREPDRVLPPAAGWDRVLHHLTATVRAMVYVQVCGGMRPQDVCRMQRRDLSTKPNERVEFPGTGRFVEAMNVGGVPVWIYMPSAHKTSHLGRPRAIALGPKAQAILSPLVVGLQAEEQVFSLSQHFRELPRGKNAHKDRTRFTPQVYGQYIARTIAAANQPLIDAGMPAAHLIPHWTPHQLRHLQATTVGDEIDREHARALLGHAGGGNMIDRYMEQQLGKAAKAAAKCG